MQEAIKKEKAERAEAEGAEATAEKSVFHGKQDADYQGGHLQKGS